MTTKPATPGTRNTPAKRLSPRTLGIRQKQAEAARLYGLGLSLREIAAQLGYESKAGASRAVQAVLNRVDSVEADTLRAAHEERIGAGYRVVFEVMNQSYPAIVPPAGMDEAEGHEWAQRVADLIEEKAELKLKAVDRLNRLMEREARLHGLDAPTKVQTDGESSFNLVVNPALMPLQWRTAHGFPDPTVPDPMVPLPPLPSWPSLNPGRQVDYS